MSSLKILESSGFFYEKEPESENNNLLDNNFINSQKALLDGFDGLWNATAESLIPSSLDYFNNNFNKNKTETEELSYLQEELFLLKDENNRLKQEISVLQETSDLYSRLKRDYESLVNFNRCLTKQLNEYNTRCHEASSKIKAIKELLF